jgi:hypothetical protein
MLVKQRDNEISILVNYLNKKKEAGGDVPGVPVQREDTMNTTQDSKQSNSYEESKQPTLFQMMRGPASPRVMPERTVADKRRDFELAQETIKKANGIAPDMMMTQSDG